MSLEAFQQIAPPLESQPVVPADGVEKMDGKSNLRPLHTSPDLETKEREWWDKFSELEDRFAWVQTSAMQKILRGDYIREIVNLTRKNGRILELGCGTGWLCRELARHGAKEVWGVDFSPKQIELAESQSRAARLDDRLNFRCADGTTQSLNAGVFDTIVLHGFLHHLDQTEIKRTLAGIPEMLSPDGRLIVFEPIRHELDADRGQSTWEAWQWWLAGLARRGMRSGLRKESEEEKRWRALFHVRHVGLAPHGPSPKEMPFAPGELETYLGDHFGIASQRHCMSISHLVVQEWLLRELSHPRSTKLALPWIARIASIMDKRFINEGSLRAGVWTFTMFVCQRNRSKS